MAAAPPAKAPAAGLLMLLLLLGHAAWAQEYRSFDGTNNHPTLVNR